MINRLEFLIMFFGFSIMAEINPSAVMIIGSLICGIAYGICVLDDLNYQDDYEEDN